MKSRKLNEKHALIILDRLKSIKKAEHLVEEFGQLEQAMKWCLKEKEVDIAYSLLTTAEELMFSSGKTKQQRIWWEHLVGINRQSRDIEKINLTLYRLALTLKKESELNKNPKQCLLASLDALRELMRQQGNINIDHIHITRLTGDLLVRLGNYDSSLRAQRLQEAFDNYTKVVRNAPKQSQEFRNALFAQGLLLPKIANLPGQDSKRWFDLSKNILAEAENLFGNDISMLGQLWANRGSMAIDMADIGQSNYRECLVEAFEAHKKAQELCGESIPPVLLGSRALCLVKLGEISLTRPLEYLEEADLLFSRAYQRLKDRPEEAGRVCQNWGTAKLALAELDPQCAHKHLSGAVEKFKNAISLRSSSTYFKAMGMVNLCSAYLCKAKVSGDLAYADLNFQTAQKLLSLGTEFDKYARASLGNLFAFMEECHSGIFKDWWQKTGRELPTWLEAQPYLSPRSVYFIFFYIGASDLERCLLLKKMPQLMEKEVISWIKNWLIGYEDKFPSRIFRLLDNASSKGLDNAIKAEGFILPPLEISKAITKMIGLTNAEKKAYLDCNPKIKERLIEDRYLSIQHLEQVNFDEISQVLPELEHANSEREFIRLFQKIKKPLDFLKAFDRIIPTFASDPLRTKKLKILREAISVSNLEGIEIGVRIWKKSVEQLSEFSNVVYSFLNLTATNEMYRFIKQHSELFQPDVLPTVDFELSRNEDPVLTARLETSKNMLKLAQSKGLEWAAVNKVVHDFCTLNERVDLERAFKASLGLPIHRFAYDFFEEFLRINSKSLEFCIEMEFRRDLLFLAHKIGFDSAFEKSENKKKRIKLFTKALWEMTAFPVPQQGAYISKHRSVLLDEENLALASILEANSKRMIAAGKEDPRALECTRNFIRLLKECRDRGIKNAIEYATNLIKTIMKLAQETDANSLCIAMIHSRDLLLSSLTVGYMYDFATGMNRPGVDYRVDILLKSLEFLQQNDEGNLKKFIHQELAIESRMHEAFEALIRAEGLKEQEQVLRSYADTLLQEKALTHLEAGMSLEMPEAVMAQMEHIWQLLRDSKKLGVSGAIRKMQAKSDAKIKRELAHTVLVGKFERFKQLEKELQQQFLEENPHFFEQLVEAGLTELPTDKLNAMAEALGFLLYAQSSESRSVILEKNKDLLSDPLMDLVVAEFIKKNAENPHAQAHIEVTALNSRIRSIAETKTDKERVKSIRRLLSNPLSKGGALVYLGQLMSDLLPAGAEKLAEACNFQPIALNIASVMLRGKTEMNWLELAEQIKNTKIKIGDQQSIQGVNQTLNAIYEVSFRALSKSQRDRLLDFAVFEEEETISLQTMSLWWQKIGIDRNECEKTLAELLASKLLCILNRETICLYKGQRNFLRAFQSKKDLLKRSTKLFLVYENHFKKNLPPVGADFYYKNYFDYLRNTCQTEKKLRLLRNFDWIRTKLESLDAHSVSLDFDMAGDASYGFIGKSLRLSAYCIDKDPSQLTGQLLARLTPKDSKIAADILHKATEKTAYFRPIIPSLTRPGGPLIRTMIGHHHRILSAAITPDGVYALTASVDRKINVWEISSGHLVSKLEGHLDTVKSVVVSPNGAYALSTSKDRTIKVWDTATWSHRATLKGHTHGVEAAAFFANGLKAISVCSDGKVKFWDLNSATEESGTKIPFKFVKKLVTTLNGKLVLFSDDNVIRVWDLRKGIEIASLVGHIDQISTLAVSFDGKRVLSGSYNGQIKLWNLKTKKEILSIDKYYHWVTCLAFTPDRKYAVSSSDSTVLRIWDLVNGREVGSLHGHSWSVWAVAISPNGVNILSAGNDAMVKLWTLNPEMKISSEDSGHSINCIAATQDSGHAVSIGSNGIINYWDLIAGKKLISQTTDSETIRVVDFCDDGEHILCGSLSGKVKVFDLLSGTERQVFNGEKPISAMGIVKEKNLVVTAFDDGSINVWKLSSGKIKTNFKGHDQAVTTIAFTPDRKGLLSGATDGSIKLWSLPSGKLKRNFPTQPVPIRVVGITPDGQRALAGLENGFTLSWDMETGLFISAKKASGNGVTAMAFSLDRNWALFSTIMGEIILWDLKSEEILATFTAESPIRSLAITPDCKTAIAGSDLGRIHLLRIIIPD